MGKGLGRRKMFKMQQHRVDHKYREMVSRLLEKGDHPCFENKLRILQEIWDREHADGTGN